MFLQPPRTCQYIQQVAASGFFNLSTSEVVFYLEQKIKQIQVISLKKSIHPI